MKEYPPVTTTATLTTSVPAAPVPVIRADGVRLVRDGNVLLDSVSLTVRSGEHWALLGANGAGKSTLLGLLGAVTHPTHGSVEVLGRTIGRVDLRELRTLLGHVNPRHPLRSPLSVREVVLTGLTNSVEPVPRWSASVEQQEQADRLLKMLGMQGKTGSRWPSLSQGERGRTLIARALMPQRGCCSSTNRPPVWISPPASSCWTPWTPCARNTPGWRRSWSRTISRNCPPPPRMRCCFGRGGVWPRVRPTTC